MRKTLIYPVIAALVICGCNDNYPDNDNVTVVEVGDTPEQIIEKAVKTRPSARQAEAMNDEFIAFVCIGPNTFTGKEWGTGDEDPKVFDLKTLDTDQWCSVLKDAGMTKVVITVKHHDGFVIYQSRYTTHGIMSSDFMEGKGDVLKSLSRSCEKYGLKLGVYLSPADLYQMNDENGLYGNGSAATMRTIPRQVKDRPFSDKRTFQFEVDDYNEYFMNQLFELLTEYGPIHEVWFDGAHPRRKGNQQYNYDAWKELIRTLAPDAVMFGLDDVRWCGNEAGDTRKCEWNVLPFSKDGGGLFAAIDAEDLGSRELLLGLEPPFTLRYQPAETDVSIRNGWFWRNDSEQLVRSADNVFDIYERSVGGNSILILNVPPTKDGVLGERDVRTLKEVGARIRQTYDKNLCKNRIYSSVDVGVGLEMELSGPVKVNRVVLSEPVPWNGERIEQFAVDVVKDGKWEQVYTGGNVGHKRIARFATVTTDKVRVRILSARADAKLSRFSAHYYPEHPFDVTASFHSDGTVTISPDTHNGAILSEQNWAENLNPSAKIHYTIDGSDPELSSPIYDGPFKFQNGILKAASFLDGVRGNVYELRVGYDRSRWFVKINPMETVIDCRKQLLISGFNFIPNTNNYNGDYVSRAVLSVSDDCRKWTKVADCEFGNIINNPTRRTVNLAEPVTARYVRMDVLQLVGDGDGFQSRDSEIEVF
ncbi:MAG: alpha-L-fucosidase [Bacteroidales bacterium]|nr:alpha-L-fucosidase [Candidatus Cacconaster scatequi]